MKKFNYHPNINIFKVILYIIICVVFLFNLTCIFSAIEINNYEIKAEKLALESKDIFKENSFKFSPYSYKKYGFENTNDFLESIKTDLGKGFVGFVDRDASMVTKSSLRNIMPSPNFIFNEEYFTLVDGTMPNVLATSDEYVEAILGIDTTNSTRYNNTEVGKSHIIKFEKDGKVKNVTIKIVGHFDSSKNYPLSEENITTFIPDISKMINLEMIPLRGQSIYAIFDCIENKVQAASILQEYGIVKDVKNEEETKSHNIINFKVKENKTLIFVGILVSGVLLVLLLIICYYLFKKQSSSFTKPQLIFIFLLPIIAVMLFLIISSLISPYPFYDIIGYGQSTFFAKIFAFLLLLIASEIGFGLHLFQKKSVGGKND